MTVATATALTLSLLAGCALISGGDGGGGAAAQALENFEFTGYPMDAEDVEVTFWLWGGPQLHAAFANWQDSPFHAGLNERTGVNIEWMFPPAGAADESQEFNLILASGNFPDIMFSGLIMGDADRLIEENVLRDLTEYMPRYAPNYYAFLHENPARVRAMRTDSGRYFGFGFFREDGGWNDTYQGPLVRQDWLDELGLASPVTIADWDYTLRAFNDAFGATFMAPWGRFHYSGNISGAFGARGGIQYQLYIDRDDNNRVGLAQVSPAWRDYVYQLSQWWQDGLIDQDLLTNDDAMVRSKVLNNETGLAFSSMGQLTGWINDANEAESGSNWVGLNYPTGNDGTLTSVFGGTGIGGTSTSVTTNVEDDRLEIVMRLLDFAYSDEGFMYWNFGNEGVSWNMEGGRPIFSDLLHNDPDGIHGSMTRFVGSVWNGPTIQATEVLIQRNHPMAIEANNTWFYPNRLQSENFGIPRGVSLTATEMNRVGEIEGPIRTYIDEMAVRFITGAEPIENFDSFVANIEAMGLQELLDFHQAAVNRFFAR